MLTKDLTPIPLNSIFCLAGEYWMVTGPAKNFLGRPSYPVVKCTTTGRPFKKTNGYTAEYLSAVVAGRFADCRVVRMGGDVGTPAYHKDSVRDGVKARRVLHLEAEIASMQRELERLHSEGY